MALGNGEYGDNFQLMELANTRNFLMKIKSTYVL